LDQLLVHIHRCRGLATTHAPPILTRAVPMITNGFCVFLPLCLVTTMGWLTPVATALVCLVYLLPNAIASALSVPYGAHGDCLPLYRDSRQAETTLRAALGQDALPRALEPFGGVIR
jgi:putative membrane protein